MFIKNSIDQVYNVNMGTAVEPIGRMPPYGPEHLSILVLTVVVSIAVVFVGRHLRGTDLEDRLLRIGGWIMLTVTIA